MTPLEVLWLVACVFVGAWCGSRLMGGARQFGVFVIMVAVLVILLSVRG